MLILIFSKKINDIKICNELKIFFENNINELFYYNLGPIPLLFWPNINIFNNTFKEIYCTSSHAIIYPKKIQYDIMTKMNNNIQHWDWFLMKTYKNYFYKYPLFYQTYSQTSNQKYWYSNNHNSLFHKISNYIIININILLQPGFNIIYISSFIFNYILFSILLISFLLFVKRINKYS